MEELYAYSLEHRVEIVLPLLLLSLVGLMMLGRWSSYVKVPRERTADQPLTLGNLLGDEPDNSAQTRDWMGATADVAVLFVLVSAVCLGSSMLLEWLGDADTAIKYWNSSLVFACLPWLLVGSAIDMHVWTREME